jgi:hypothetical protein
MCLCSRGMPGAVRRGLDPPKRHAAIEGETGERKTMRHASVNLKWRRAAIEDSIVRAALMW